MLFRTRIFIVMLLLLSVAAQAEFSEMLTVHQDEYPTIVESPVITELDDYNDSLSYFDQAQLAQYYVSESNFYSLVRFTPQYDFQLQGVGIFGRMEFAPDTLHFFVYENNAGQPGQLLLEWIDQNVTVITINYPRIYLLGDLPESEFVDLPGGVDFWISVKVPGRSGLSSPWTPYFDMEETQARNFTSSQPNETTWPVQGDWGISALGTYVIGDADLEITGTHSTDQSYHRFEPATVFPIVSVRNNGPSAVDNAVYSLSMLNFDNNQSVYTLNYPLPVLSPGDEIELNLDGQAIPVPTGAWSFEASVSSPGDNFPNNNSYEMLQQAGGTGTVFRYDDGTYETTFSSAFNTGYGNIFYPPEDGAMLEAAEFYAVEENQHFTVQAWLVNSGEMVDGGTYLTNVGWNTFSFLPQLYTEPVAIVIIGDPGETIPLDQSHPQVIDNPDMPMVSVTNDWGTFSPFTTGIFLMRAQWGRYLGPDLHFTDQPYNIGEALVNQPYDAFIPIANTGQSAAEISNISENYAALVVLVDNYPVTIQPGETFDIPVRWTPSLTGQTSMTLQISHDDLTLETPFPLQIVGTGVDIATIDIEPSAGLPLIVPAGSNFWFDLAVQVRNVQNQVTADLWTSAILPNGNELGPIENIRLPILPWMSFQVNDIRVGVPAFAPPGNYTWQMKLGLLPNFVATEDSFPFEITATPGQSGAQDWSVTGLERAAIAMDQFEEQVSVTPVDYQLSQAYPNPFNPTAQISVSLPAVSDLNVSVYDIQGRLVTELANSNYVAGTHTFTLNGQNWASGIYFVQAHVAGQMNVVRKVSLIK